MPGVPAAGHISRGFWHAGAADGCPKCDHTITPQQALATARAYVATHRSYLKVTHLLQDAADYMAITELVDPTAECPVGPGPIFVRKSTGRIWTEGSAFGGSRKVAGMRA